MRQDIHIQVSLPELDGQAAEAGGLPKRRNAPAGGASLSLGAMPAGTSLLELTLRLPLELKDAPSVSIEDFENPETVQQLLERCEGRIAD